MTGPDTLAARLTRLGEAVDRGDLDAVPAARLGRLVAELARAADVRLPVDATAPPVVQHRLLGRLASRTAGREIRLDVADRRRIERAEAALWSADDDAARGLAAAA